MVTSRTEHKKSTDLNFASLNSKVFSPIQTLETARSVQESTVICLDIKNKFNPMLNYWKTPEGAQFNAEDAGNKKYFDQLQQYDSMST